MKRNVFSLLVLGAAVCLQPAMATDGETLFKSKPCVGCHMVDAKLVGPSFKEVAAKYDGQADAATLLAGRIKNGTQGTWGSAHAGQRRHGRGGQDLGRMGAQP